MKQTDSLGRATFHRIAPQMDVRPTNRDLRWLAHIARHGPQSSAHLYELTRDTHHCRDTALRQLQKLRAGGYIRLTQQQRQTAHADFNPYIYDLTDKGRSALVDRGLDEPAVTPRGHWWHSFEVARVTSSVDILAARAGIRFIPAHSILALKGVSLGIPVSGGRLIPDQLFALDYGGTYRAFALEIDRGTEPISATALRKSWQTALVQYRQVLNAGLHRSHYGLKANLLVLWVFSTRSREQRFLELIGKSFQPIASSVLTTSAESIGIQPHASTSGSTIVCNPFQRLGAQSLDVLRP